MKRWVCIFALMLLLSGCGKAPGETQPTLPDTSTAPVPTQTQPTEAPTTQPTEAPTTQPTQPPQKRMVFTFAGDCTLGCDKGLTRAGYAFPMTVGEDYGYPFRNVLPWFENDDFTMVNLEGVLGDQGAPAGKRYAFRGRAEYVNILTQNSVEAVSLANNHVLDYGEKGYGETKRLLEEAGVSYVETNNSTILTLENGVTVGIYGTVYNSVKRETMVEGIRALKEQGVDILIYAPHWGTEHSFRPTTGQKELGRAAIDAGANLVFGCHPHVLQPIEEYNGGVILYSLGNFSFGGNLYPGDYDTAVIQQEILLDADGTVTMGQRTIVPCSLSSMEKRNNFQPTPYPEGSEAYDRVLSKLDGTYAGPNLPIS